MKTVAMFIAGMFLVAAQAQANSTAKWNSVYTDLKKDCVVISLANEHAEIDFSDMECKSYGGYRLTIGGGDLRYSPTLSFGGQEIQIDKPWSFHDVASNKVEWLYISTLDNIGAGTIDWKGFIYRMSVAHEDGESSSDILYAVRLDGANTCLIGTAKTNQGARDLVYNSRAGCR